MRSRTVTVSTSTSCGDAARARAQQHAPERLDQLEEADLDLALGLRHGLGLGALRLEDVAPEQRRSSSSCADLLEALVLEQARHQLGARVAALLVRLAPVGRQQHARLDPGQGRRHQQVLAGDVEVELAHQLERREVLLRDRARSGCR